MAGSGELIMKSEGFMRSKTHHGKHGDVTYYYWVVSQRDGDKVRQVILDYLGAHPSREAAEEYYRNFRQERVMQAAADAPAAVADPLLQDSAVAASENPQEEIERLRKEVESLRQLLDQKEVDPGRVVPKNTPTSVFGTTTRKRSAPERRVRPH
jgi:hypothetical protein